MNIFIYSDESGVLDKKHNDIFVFGGLIFLSKEERDICSRKYTAAENVIRLKEAKEKTCEIKATTVSNESKGKLFRSLNQVEKFGIVINQNKLKDEICNFKKTKQRYLDWAYKYAVRKKLEALISQGRINPSEVERMFFYVDQHNTATDGIYELKESLEEEFRTGMCNFNYMTFHPPLFKNLLDLQVLYCDSKANTLIRSADIVANRLFYMARIKDYSEVESKNFHITYHPPF